MHSKFFVCHFCFKGAVCEKYQYHQDLAIFLIFMHIVSWPVLNLILMFATTVYLYFILEFSFMGFHSDIVIVIIWNVLLIYMHLTDTDTAEALRETMVFVCYVHVLIIPCLFQCKIFSSFWNFRIFIVSRIWHFSLDLLEIWIHSLQVQHMVFLEKSE